METHQTLQGIDWLSGEVEASLALAYDALEQFLRASSTAEGSTQEHNAAQEGIAPGETGQEGPAILLQRCFDYFHQVQGSLKIAQCEGGAILVAEMEMVVSALSTNSLANVSEACEVLVQGINSVPSYMKQLIAGGAEHPASLVTMLNDLRAVRGERLFTESVIFTPNLNMLDAAEAAFATPNQAALRDLVKKLRKMYQAALLGLLKAKSPNHHLKNLEKVTARLRELCRGTAREQLWRTAGAFVEGLFHLSIPLSSASRFLLRDLDKEIRLLADSGTGAFDAPFPRQLFNNLLYYVAVSGGDSPRIQSVREAFDLESSLPAASPGGMGGGAEHSAGSAWLDSQLIDAVTHGLARELESVKDLVEEYIASDIQNTAPLQQTLAYLKRIADTLAMVSQFSLRQTTLAIVELTDELVDGNDRGAASMEKLAGLIMDLESAINAWRISAHPQRGAAELPPSQRMEVNRAWVKLLEEVICDLDGIKQSVLAYVSAQRDVTHLAETPAALARVAAVLDLVGLQRCGAIVKACGEYVQQEVVSAAHAPEWRHLDTLADVITSIDHYLADRLAGSPEGSHALLNLAELSINKLGYAPQVPPEASFRDAAPANASTRQSHDSGQAATPQVPPYQEQESMDHDEIDPEIREVFVEEAAEVLATLQEFYPRWAVDQDNAEALTETRRAFHTLKGSGRMVGASDIGELAWSLENLLNRIIEGRISATPALLACLGESLGLLPAMVSAFDQGSRAFDQQRVEMMRSVATRLAEGESIDLAAMDSAPTVTAASANASAEADDDHLLLEIFAKEALGHLDVVRQFVALQRSKAPFYEHPSSKLQGALHTLKGSAHMANIESLAELVTPLERFMREMLNFQVALDPDIVDLLADGVDYSQRIVAGLKDNSGFDAAELDIFKARVHELREKAIGPSLGQGEEPLRAVDPAFLNLIMADGMQRVLDVEATLDAWCHATDFELARLQGVSAELRELENGAERAGLAPLTALTGHLAACYDSILEKRIAPSEEGKATLLAAHEVLLDMVDGVAAHQDIVPMPEALQADIAALAASPGMAESDDAANLATALAQMVLPDDADAEIVELFLQEADELLESMEHSFQEWREAPQDSAAPDSLKRTLHTFKGGARMAGLEALGNVSHDLEAVVIAKEKQVADGSTSAIASMLAYHDVLANGVDLIRKAYQQSLQSQAPLDELTSAAESAASAAVIDHTTVEESTSAPESIAGQPGSDAAAGGEISPHEAWPSAEILPFTGTYRGLDSAAPGASDAEQQAAALEMVKVAAPMLDTLVNLAGETSISRGQVEQHISEFMFSLDEMEATIRRMHDQVRRLGIETDAQVMFRREQIESSDSSEGFDPLEMDRYSQLQQLSRSLLESASDVQDLRDTLVDKARDAESLLLQQSRINTDLQEGLMRTRMVPFSRLVPRLRRIVRQVGNTLGKQVVLKLESIEGEIDRSILERIVPSLEHMIRNAVDHGIESEAERLALGKSVEGTLSLSFAREGGDVLIRLADDGRGLNVDAIRAKALSSGLMPEHATYSDQDIYAFIFAPGFSTSSEVTQISGRGVGMDVVNSDVRQLGGSVSIASQSGAGTEFTVRLPFTVSVNRALMIEAGEDSYALALSSISGVTRLPPEELTAFYQNPRKKLAYGGEHYEVRYLGSLLSPELRPTLDTAMGQLPLVLIRSEGRNYAVQVDGLIGSREIVVKTLGAQFSRVPGLSGATVLGDGRVVVILDLQALLRDQPVLAALAPQVVEKAPEADHVPLIMVVDDSVTVRKVTGRFLEREGFRVITAKDGVDAMRVLQDNTPDVMLLDIEMPRMDGFEVARLVRSTQRLKNLPIVMITSRTGEKHRERALAMGVDRYLGKPYQEEVLISTVYEMLRRVDAAAEQAG